MKPIFTAKKQAWVLTWMRHCLHYPSQPKQAKNHRPKHLYRDRDAATLSSASSDHLFLDLRVKCLSLCNQCWKYQVAWVTVGGGVEAHESPSGPIFCGLLPQSHQICTAERLKTKASQVCGSSWVLVARGGWRPRGSWHPHGGWRPDDDCIPWQHFRSKFLWRYMAAT